MNGAAVKSCGESAGILFLAAALRSKGYSVSIFDCLYGEYQLDKLEKFCEGKSFRLVGISIPSLPEVSLEWIGSVINLLKKILSSAIITCGGLGASLRYEELLTVEGLDAVMLGEGEQTIGELAMSIECGVSIDGISGLVTKYKRDIRRRELINNLDSLPFMARDTFEKCIKDVPVEKRKKLQLSIYCARGCKGVCTYCINSSVFRINKGDRFRQRSVESLAKEINELNKRYGITNFNFWDDYFVPLEAGYEKAELLLETFQKLDFKPNFTIQINAPMVRGEIIELLQRAGMRSVYIGIQNINSGELKLLGKKTTQDQIKNALETMNKYGYNCSSQRMYGMTVGYIAFTPYTTVGNFINNVEFINNYELPVESINTRLFAVSNTPVWLHLKKSQLLGKDNSWRFEDKNIAIVYEFISRIMEEYLLWKNSIRFISRVAEYSDILLQRNELDAAMEKLETLTGKEICIYADELRKSAGVPDNKLSLAFSTVQQIRDIAKHYSIKERYDDFITVHEKDIQEFNQVSNYIA